MYLERTLFTIRVATVGYAADGSSQWKSKLIVIKNYSFLWRNVVSNKLSTVQNKIR